MGVLFGGPCECQRIAGARAVEGACVWCWPFLMEIGQILTGARTPRRMPFTKVR